MLRACASLFCVAAAAGAHVAHVRAPPSRAAVSVSPTDPAIWYTPYVWNAVGGSGAMGTINSGATMRVFFSGNTVTLTFDVSQMVTPISQIYTAIDNGPVQQWLVSPTISLAVPANLTHGDVPWHTLEVMVKSTTERANRWNPAAPSTRVVFTGLTLAAGGAVAAWLPKDANLLIYGDSITEGVLTLGGSQADDTDHNDAQTVWSHALGGLLGAEAGVVGFGATGLTRGGSGGVPALGSSWNQTWSGAMRSFLPRPDLIVFNEGTNDGSNNLVPQMTAVLNSLFAACPGTPIAVLVPFNGAEAAGLAAAIAASDKPSLATLISTAGFYNTSFGGALHPTGPNDVARVAPQVAAKLRPLLVRSLAARYANEEQREQTAF